MNKIIVVALSLTVSLGVMFPQSSAARDIEYNNSEVSINVAPGEATQITFPGVVAGGFKKRLSSLTLEKSGTNLIIFAKEGLPKVGESIIVRMKDSRTYSIRILPAKGEEAPRDDIVRIEDGRLGFAEDESELKLRNKDYSKASSNTVPGLMRELVLVSELGKKKIRGYRASDKYKDDVVLDDGTILAKIETIFIGSNLWGYVIEATNLLPQGQKLNAATFRLDGTRAISAKSWELAPKPLTVEQQIAGKDKTKIYVITKAQR